MAYITASDIENVFGENNVTVWSDLDNAGSRDSARVTSAIAYAEGYVNDRFRGSRYVVPFAGTLPKHVIDIVAKIAGVWLYTSRGTADFDEVDDPILAHKRRADADIARILDGSVEVDLPRLNPSPSYPVIIA